MNPCLRAIYRHLGPNFISRLVWALALTSIGVSYTILLSTSYLVYFFFPSSLLVAGLCATALWPKRSSLSSDAFFVIAHTITLLLYGAFAMSHPQEPLHTHPCFTFALQLLCSHMAIPFRLQILPLACAVLIPLTIYPSFFFTPAPVVCCLATIAIVLQSSRTLISAAPGSGDATQNASCHRAVSGFAGLSNITSALGESSETLNVDVSGGSPTETGRQTARSSLESYLKRGRAEVGDVVRGPGPIPGMTPAWFARPLMDDVMRRGSVSDPEDTRFETVSNRSDRSTNPLTRQGPVLQRSPRHALASASVISSMPPQLGEISVASSNISLVTEQDGYCSDGSQIGVGQLAGPIAERTNSSSSGGVLSFLRPRRLQPVTSATDVGVAVRTTTMTGPSSVSLSGALPVRDSSDQSSGLSSSDVGGGQVASYSSRDGGRRRPVLPSLQPPLPTTDLPSRTSVSKPSSSSETQATDPHNIIFDPNPPVVSSDLSVLSPTTPTTPDVLQEHIMNRAVGRDVEKEMVQQRVKLREVQRKYNLLKVHFDSEVSRGVELEASHQRHQVEEMKQKYDSLSHEVMESKLKADQDLLDQSQQIRDMKLKYGLLKVHFDQAMVAKRNSDENLLRESAKALELKLKYEELLSAGQHSPGQGDSPNFANVPTQTTTSTSTNSTPNASSLSASIPPFLSPSADPGQINAEQRTPTLQSEDLKPESVLSPLPISSPPSFAVPDPTNLLEGYWSINNISQDMRTPLTTALAVLEILLDDRVVLSPPDQKDLLQKAWAAMQSVLILINNILDFTKFQNAGMQPRPQQVNIRRLAIQILRALEVQANQMQVELIFKAFSTLPTFIFCDRLLLQRVLMNLLANALKLSPAMGRIELALWFDSESNVFHGSVTDDGDGMTPAEQAAVFQRLHQHGYEKGGTGLGLTICKQLIASMNGKISAYSEGRGRGSTFSFEFPVPPMKNVATYLDSAVVVLDENPVRYEATVQMLKYAGACVLDAIPETSIHVNVAFISITERDWKSHALHWKTQRNSLVCVIVPNTHTLRLDQTEAVDYVLRSPINVAELREIVHKQGECIHSDSSSHVSRGSCTSASNSNPSAPESIGTPQSNAAVDAQILLVEDNRTNHKLFLRQLTTLGLTNIHSAFDGREAIDLARQNRYALFVMDCELPHVDGFEATAEIRKMEHHKSTPIVALTGNFSSETARRCLECGITEFFTKPITPQQWQAIYRLARNAAKRVDESISPRIATK